jgi:hypothetical protein
LHQAARSLSRDESAQSPMNERGLALNPRQPLGQFDQIVVEIDGRTHDS